jgi:hypothetical protein
VIHSGKVKARATIEKAQAARNLPHDRAADRDRQGQQQLDRAGAAFFRPQPHADGGQQEQEQPGQVGEERRQVGLAAREERADIEGKDAGDETGRR